MTAEYPIPVNTHVTLHRKEIKICSKKGNYKIAIAEIKKIYLKKKKPGVLYAIMSLATFIDNIYYLHIKTRDNQEIKIKLKDYERQYFIELISSLRKLKKNTQSEMSASADLAQTA